MSAVSAIIVFICLVRGRMVEFSAPLSLSGCRILPVSRTVSWRAAATREYPIQQSLTESNITATGFGKTLPVADNRTADGRHKNRRVEVVVGGEVIGAKIGK